MSFCISPTGVHVFSVDNFRTSDTLIPVFQSIIQMCILIDRTHTCTAFHRGKQQTKTRPVIYPYIYKRLPNSDEKPPYEHSMAWHGIGSMKSTTKKTKLCEWIKNYVHLRSICVTVIWMVRVCMRVFEYEWERRSTHNITVWICTAKKWNSNSNHIDFIFRFIVYVLRWQRRIACSMVRVLCVRWW